MLETASCEEPLEVAKLVRRNGPQVNRIRGCRAGKDVPVGFAPIELDARAGLPLDRLTHPLRGFGLAER